MASKQSATLEELRFAILATDVVLFTVRDGELLVRLMRVENDPRFPIGKGFPGGLILPHETGRDSAQRHLHKKVGISPDSVHMEQLFTFSKVDRDPRGRVVAIAYIAVVPWEALSQEEQRDTDISWWSPISRAKKLAYDHDTMLSTALERLRSRADLIGRLMPKEFTLTELEKLFEVVLGKKLDKRNFRKRMLKLKMVKKLSTMRRGGRFRPAQLYAFSVAAAKTTSIS